MYSAVRRRVQGQPASHADSEHLHHLIRNAMRGDRNSLVSPIVWAFNLAPITLGVLLYDGTLLLVLAALACCLAYHCTHRFLLDA
jgi:hypothetical protein